MRRRRTGRPCRDNPAAGFRSGRTNPPRQSSRRPMPSARFERVRPTTSTPRFAAAIARLPQPQPISSRRCPGFRSSRSSSMRPCAAAHLRGSSRAGEPRRAVGHRLVEPGGIEIVAEIVVRGDVLRAPFRGALSRRRCASALTSETAPWRGRRRRARRRWPKTARRSRPDRGSTIRPRSTPCTNRPSPRSPAEPAPASCDRCTTAVGPGAAKAEPALRAVRQDQLRSRHTQAGGRSRSRTW